MGTLDGSVLLKVLPLLLGCWNVWLLSKARGEAKLSVPLPDLRIALPPSKVGGEIKLSVPLLVGVVDDVVVDIVTGSRTLSVMCSDISAPPSPTLKEDDSIYKNMKRMTREWEGKNSEREKERKEGRKRVLR